MVLCSHGVQKLLKLCYGRGTPQGGGCIVGSGNLYRCFLVLNVINRGLHSYKPGYSGCHRAGNCRTPFSEELCTRGLLFNISIYLFEMGNLFKDFRNRLEKCMKGVVYYLTTWKMLSTVALTHNYSLGGTAV